MRLIPEAKRYGVKGALWRLWSARLALFWAGFSAFVLAFPALMDLIDPHLFVGLSVVFGITIAGARILKQPGLSDGD